MVLLDPGKGLGIDDVVALTVLGRDVQAPPGRHVTGPHRVVAGDDEFGNSAVKPALLIAHEGTGQQMCLAQHLETVADAQHRHSLGGSLLDLADHRGQGRDGTSPEVVAVGESAGQDDGVHTVQVCVGVPQTHGLGPGDAHGANGILVVKGAGKGDDSDPRCHDHCSTWMS